MLIKRWFTSFYLIIPENRSEVLNQKVLLTVKMAQPHKCPVSNVCSLLSEGLMLWPTVTNILLRALRGAVL